MRKIEDLKPNECIHIRTKKEAKEFHKLMGISDIKNAKLYIDTYLVKKRFSYSFLSTPSEIELPASDFIKPSKLKDIQTEITRLDNRVRDLEVKEITNNIEISFDNVPKEKPSTELETEKWYIYSDGSIIFNSKEEYGYGVSIIDNEWVPKARWLKHKINGTDYRLATIDEVNKVLTQQAVKMGYKNGASIVYPWIDKDIHTPEFKDKAVTGFFGIHFMYKGVKIMKDGIWAEIVTPAAEEIDWSKAGQLLKHTQYNRIVFTDGKHTGGIFSGTLLVTDGSFKLGYDIDWGKEFYKLYIGEPITLSNQ